MSTKDPFAAIPSFNNTLSFEDPKVDEIEEVLEEKDKEEVIVDEDKDKEAEIEDVLDTTNYTFASDDDEEISEAIAEGLETDEKDFDYKKLYQSLVDIGTWVEVEGIDDISLDKETFTKIVKLQEEEKTKEIEEKIYSNITDEEKEFFDFKSKGEGDLAAYMQNFMQTKRLESIPMETDQDKLNVIFSYYTTELGRDEKWANKQIERLIKDMEVDDEATLAYNKLNEKLKKEKEQILAHQQQQIELKEAAIKEYKKGLKDTLKSKNFDSSKINNIVKGLTEVDKTGFTTVDKAYLEFRNNPEKSVQLFQFLTDYDKFVESITSNKVNTEKKRLFLELKNSKNTPQERLYTEQNNNTRKIKNPLG